MTSWQSWYEYREVLQYNHVDKHRPAVFRRAGASAFKKKKSIICSDNVEAISPQCPDTKTEWDAKKWTASSNTKQQMTHVKHYCNVIRGEADCFLNRNSCMDSCPKQN